MRLPIDTNKLTIVVIGDVTPLFVFGTTNPRRNQQGQELFRVPVLISGTADREDPTAFISVPGPVPSLVKGAKVQVTGLTIANWSLRGTEGIQRQGISLKAETISPVPTKVV
jgi:hypothetical protein